VVRGAGAPPERDIMYKRFAGLSAPKRCVSTACYRCGGTGYVHPWGTCFRCGGAQVDPSHKDFGYPQTWTDAEIEEWDRARRAKNEKARVAREERLAVKKAAKFAENLAKCPELADIKDYGGILGDLREKAEKYDLSPAQFELVAKLVAQDKAYAIAKAAQVEADAHLIYIGEVGEKITITGTVKVAKAIDTQFGLSRLLIVADTDGNLIKAFTTAQFVWDLEAGDEVTLIATVKAHEVYEDVKQTVITRPKLIEHKQLVDA
jgi:hypothetical protein